MPGQHDEAEGQHLEQHVTEAAKNATIPDVLPAPGDAFRVLFTGINPGLYSAATGWHFARPGNRFWPALHASGFTPRQLSPSEQAELARYGLGITNIAPRATAQAAALFACDARVGWWLSHIFRFLPVIQSHLAPRTVSVSKVAGASGLVQPDRAGQEMTG